MAQLLFFGKLGDVAGERARDWPLASDVQTIEQLLEQIEKTDPPLGAALAGMPLQVIVNEQIVPVTHVISNTDEIAFLPPVSGG